MNIILFFIVIFLSNIIQGITGFAGTILAMPFAIMLVGYNVGKPVLNLLGLFAGLYVLKSNYKSVNVKELIKIVVVMSLGIFGGIYLKALLVDHQQVLYIALGLFIMYISVKGLFFKSKERKTLNPVMTNAMLIVAGIIHGIFVSGGPLVISYLTTKINDKTAFRATISTVWVFLNTILFVDDIISGYWTQELVILQIIGMPILFLGMHIGSILYKKMNQETFMKLSYILLFIAALTLIF
ncbi:MAG: sulfite transporter TauE/SafE [Epulopiscium sp. Nele67-Bin002]|nr:MAG: sulfite transporter TauE/SafE [Epulopiscium sp. Nele67-Bin002]OON92491.1 MAG: sulfite transporter TauE/SafE [Epulopiscium sp. Nele67-Bin001]